MKEIQRPCSGRERFVRHRLGHFGVVLLLILAVFFLLAPWICPYDPVMTDLSAVRQPPGALRAKSLKSNDQNEHRQG